MTYCFDISSAPKLGGQPVPFVAGAVLGFNLPDPDSSAQAGAAQRSIRIAGGTPLPEPAVAPLLALATFAGWRAPHRAART